MDDKTKGAWLIHHCCKLENIANVNRDYEQIGFAGKCGIILNGLAGTDQLTLTMDRVDALAMAAGISTKLELPSILDELETQRLIDKGQNGIAILGLTTPETLKHTTTIFEESSPNNFENAAIDIAEISSEAPLKKTDAVEYISDTHKINTSACNELIKQYGHIGFIDTEDLGSIKLLFNGNLFRRQNIRKINGVLSSLSSKEEARAKELLSILDNSGCISMEQGEAVAGSKLISQLISIAFIDVNTIGNESGTHAFITKPSAFKKFGNSSIEDAFDLAKAFVTSLTFGMTKSSSGRGRIRMIEALMRKLTNGYWVGPATAIGQDYKVLELKGVIEVSSTGDGRFHMRLLKKDIGELALKVITDGEASTSAITQFPSVAATIYKGPEPNRTVVRKKQGQPLKQGVANLLNDLRTGGIR